MICDLAETYHIYDYKQLPARRVAVFVYGLRETSRIKMALSDNPLGFDTMLLAGIADRLSTLIWFKTKDGQRGRNQPQYIVDSLMKVKAKKENVAFETGEDFETAKKAILGGEVYGD